MILSFLSDQQFLQHVYMSTYQPRLQTYRRELNNSPHCPVAVSTQSMTRSSSNCKNYWKKSRKYCLWMTLGCTTKWISFGKPSNFMHKLFTFHLLWCHSVFKGNMDLNWSTIVVIVCIVSLYYHPCWDVQTYKMYWILLDLLHLPSDTGWYEWSYLRSRTEISPYCVT